MKLPKRDQSIHEGSNSNLFLKLKDGESITGVARGDCYEFFQVWAGNKSKVVGPDDPEGKSRFRLNFVTLEDGAFVAKIWEFPTAVYDQISELNEEYPLEKTKIKIKRNGTGTDTVYMILPLLKEPIPAKTIKEIEAVPLNMLEHKQKSQTPKSEFATNDSEEIPF